MATIFSNRNISLLLFIIIALFLGASFNVHVGPESFAEGASRSYDEEEDPTATTNPMMQLGPMPTTPTMPTM
jgi:hypothetical protein